MECLVLRLLILSVLMLTGCSSTLVQLQRITPTGTPFQIYLAQEYLDFAIAEADQYDWFDSSHFAHKGLKVAKGEYVDPEDLRYWGIVEDALPTMIQARKRLMDVLTPETMLLHPKEAAKAQFLFDCWVEQQEELWQISHIAYCRERFYDKLDELYLHVANDREKAANSPTPPEPTETEADLMAKVKTQVIYKKTETRVVYFEFNKYGLTPRAKRIISNMASELKNVKSYNITLNGYSDRVGTEDYNMKLSKNRAKSVKDALVDAGLNADAITLFAFGEITNLVETKDEVPEPENRVVEIVIEM